MLNLLIITILLSLTSVLGSVLEKLTPSDSETSDTQIHTEISVQRNHLDEDLPLLSRNKRHLTQLRDMVDEYTPYLHGQLLPHGNYCGLGGNRGGDGSTIDSCDDCCKTHDKCYDDLLVRTRETLNGVQRNCYPYTDRYFLNPRGPSCGYSRSPCSSGACSCDVEFIYCLRETRGCFGRMKRNRGRFH